MTLEEIRSNIRYNEGLLNQYSTQKGNIERKLTGLDTLKQKISALQFDLEKRQEERIKHLCKYDLKPIRNKIYSRYFEGMHDLLSGTQFHHVYEGLTSAKQITQNRIHQVLQELNECEGRISQCRESIDYWNMQLKLLPSEEGI